MNRRQFILSSLGATLALALPFKPKTFSAELDNIDVRREGDWINWRFYTCNAQGHNERLVKDIMMALPKNFKGRNRTLGYGREYEPYERTALGEKRRIEWFNWSVNIPRTNVHIFGPLKKIDQLVIEAPKVLVEIRYA